MTKDKIFLFSTFSFIVGILFFNFIKIDIWVIFLLISFLIFFVFKAGNRVFLIYFLFFCLGVFRIYLAQGDAISGEIYDYNEENVIFSGRVVENPKVSNGKQQVVLLSEKGDIEGVKILAFVSQYEDFLYGDEIYFSGNIKIPDNFSDFDYKKYLSDKGIYFISYYPDIEIISSSDNFLVNFANEFRYRSCDNFSHLFPSPYSDILSAMVLGIRSDVSDSIVEKFNITGTRHMLVVSGMHLAIITVGFLFLFLSVGVSRKKVFFCSIVAILIFVFLTGMGKSTIRAAIMVFSVLFAYKVGRVNKSFNALVLAAFLMLILNPNLLTGDLGFQLSFMATFGIITIFPFLKKKLVKFPSIYGAKDVFTVSVSAQLAILPIMIINFDGVSMLSPLANVLILPIMPAIMFGGFTVLFLSFLNFSLARIFAFPLYILLFYQIMIVDFFSEIDFAFIAF